MLPAMCSIAGTSVVFDTVTSYRSAYSNAPSNISGIEKDTGDTILTTFKHNYGDYKGAVQAICTPLVLTAMEKPGRYYLYVALDDDNDINYCTLQLKTEPE